MPLHDTSSRGTARPAVPGPTHRMVHAMRLRARAVTAGGDRGAQAAEYAMVGGVGATVCGSVVVYINNSSDGLVGGVISSLLDSATGWIGSLF